MKPKWHIDFVMRLITEYKQRAAKYEHKEKLKKENRKLVLDNIILLDKELARIDLLLSAGAISLGSPFDLPPSFSSRRVR